MKKSSCSVLAAVATLAAAGIFSWGQANEPTLRYKWSPPTYGTPVEHYVGEVQSWEEAKADTIQFEFVTDGPDTTASFTYAWGYNVRCRVAGVDANGNQGPFSLWSEIWMDQGEPGAPSTPRAELEMVAP